MSSTGNENENMTEAVPQHDSEQQHDLPEQHEYQQQQHQHQQYQQQEQQDNTMNMNGDMKIEYDPTENTAGKLFIGGLSWQTTEDGEFELRSF